MKAITKIFFTLIVLTLVGCAQITAPSGGEKDTTPPEINPDKTFPKNYSTNFEGNKIEITFNEYFVLKNPQKNVVVSPVLTEKPEFSVKAKTLIIDLKNQLKENTTYTINFGDAISDYTVGNKIPDFKYVFSTGNYIDSMRFNGTVKDAFTNKGEEGILVLLYDTFQDSVVTNSAPAYFSKTDKEGKYSFKYIKEGKYKIFALKDENRNYRYDLPNEKTGFQTSFIVLKDTQKVESIDILIFEKNYKKQAILSKKYTFPGNLTLIFIKNTHKVEIKKMDGTDLNYYIQKKSTKGDTISLWKMEEELDKTNLLIKADEFTDTIKIYKFKKPRKDTGLNQISVTNQIDENRPFTITFDRPIELKDSSKVKFFKDSVRLKLDSFKVKFKTLELYFKSKEKDRIRYEILPKSVEDIFGYSLLDTLIGFVNVREKDYYGVFTLDFKPKNDSVNYIIQLLSEDDKILREKLVFGNQKINFSKLQPGKYKVRVIQDLNKNGKWDTGDYYKNLQPENVNYFSNKIEIRSNWEMEEEFVF